jgi:hypothetical protein
MTYARYTRPTFDPTAQVAEADALARAAQRMGPDPRVLSPGYAPYLAMAAGLDDIWGEDPMILGRYARLLARTQGTDPDAMLITPVLRTMSPLFGMLRLRFVVQVTPGRMSVGPTNLPELPRATLMNDWKVLPTDQVLAALMDPAFEPARTVLLESDPGLAPAPASERGTVSVTTISTDEIEIRADAPAPAVLLVTDTYSAGWTATALAGSSQGSYRIMPANYALRAIPLTAGTHQIRLAYRPRAFAIGAWISLFSLVVLAVLAARSWLESRRHG